MHVYKEPKLTFTCRHCGAVNDGEPHEFRDRHTMPPTWDAQCGWCCLDNVVSPPALIARFAGSMTPDQIFRELSKRF